MKVTMEHDDRNREEIILLANRTVIDCLGKGWSRATVHFTFTCRHCGERCTLKDENYLWEEGECFKCGKSTVIEKAGFSLLLRK